MAEASGSRQRQAIDLRTPSISPRTGRHELVPAPSTDHSPPPIRQRRVSRLRSSLEETAPLDSVPSSPSTATLHAPLSFEHLPPMRPAHPAGPSRLPRTGLPAGHRFSFTDAQVIRPTRERIRSALEGVGSPHRGRGRDESESSTGAQRRAPASSAAIDLTGDDSDDEPVITGANIVARATPPATELPRTAAAGTLRAGVRREDVEFARTMADLDRSIHRTRLATEALLAAEEEDARLRAATSPPVRPQRQRHAPIRLGGAVLRTGDRHISYDRQRRRQEQDGSQPAQPGGEILNPLPAHHNQGWLQGLFPGGSGLLSEVHWGLGHVGPAAAAFGYGAGPLVTGRPDDVESITGRVKLPPFDPAPDGFSCNFEVKVDGPIAIDDDGKVVDSGKGDDAAKPFLACVHCTQPLLNSSAHVTGDDRVFGLRCGHLIDGACLSEISVPHTQAEQDRVIPGDMAVLGDDASRRKKKRTTTKKMSAMPDVYRWRCPAKGCGRVHVSEHKAEEDGGGLGGGGGWRQSEYGGAVSLYM